MAHFSNFCPTTSGGFGTGEWFFKNPLAPRANLTYNRKTKQQFVPRKDHP
jgi:hypothetical protein